MRGDLTESEPDRAIVSDRFGDHDCVVARRAFELSQERGNASWIVWADWRRAELEYIAPFPTNYLSGAGLPNDEGFDALIDRRNGLKLAPCVIAPAWRIADEPATK